MQGIEEGLTVGGESTAVAELGVAAAMEDGARVRSKRKGPAAGVKMRREGERATGCLGASATLDNRCQREGAAAPAAQRAGELARGRGKGGLQVGPGEEKQWWKFEIRNQGVPGLKIS